MADSELVAEPFQLDDVEVIPDELTVRRRGHSLRVEPRTMSLLQTLAAAPNKVFTRNELFDALWGAAEVSDQALTNTVWELRRALGDSPKRSRFVRTIPRRGYQLLVEPMPLAAKPNPVSEKTAKTRTALWVGGLLIAGAVAVMVWLIQRGDSVRLPDQPKLEAWSFTTGGEIQVDPVALGDDLLLGSHDGFIYLLGRTGEERWRASISTRVSLTPASDGERIYVTALDGHVYAFDRQTGRELWRRKVDAKSAPAAVADGVLVTSYQRTLLHLSADTGEPEVLMRGVGDVVLPPRLAHNAIILVEENGQVSVLDHQERSWRWRLQLEGLLIDPPTVHDDLLLLGTDAGYVYALDIADGRQRWLTRIAVRNATAVAVDAERGRVFVGLDAGELVGLALDSGNELWRIRGGSFFSTPGSAHGVVFSGNGDGLLYAVDGSDGRLLWQVELGAWLLTPALIFHGQVVVGDVSGRLHAVPLSGHYQPIAQPEPPPIPETELLWTTELGDPVTIAATYHEGLLLIGAGSSLHAVDAQSGERLWRYPTLGEIHSQPAVGGGRAWFSTRAGLLLGVSLADGADAIEVRLPAASISGPLWVGDGVVFGDQDANIHRYNEDGSLRWTVKTSITVNADPLWVDGMVVVGSCDGHVYALEPETGELIWRMNAGDCVVADTVMSESLLHTGTAEGFFLGFDRNGEERWRFSTEGEIWYEPVAAEGLVVFGSRDYHFYALDVDTGEERWRYRTGNRAVSDVVYASGLFVAGSYDGCVYALAASDGEPRWRFCGPREMINPIVVDEKVIVGGDDGVLYALRVNPQG